MGERARPEPHLAEVLRLLERVEADWPRVSRPFVQLQELIQTVVHVRELLLPLANLHQQRERLEADLRTLEARKTAQEEAVQEAEHVATTAIQTHRARIDSLEREFQDRVQHAREVTDHETQALQQQVQAQRTANQQEVERMEARAREMNENYQKTRMMQQDELAQLETKIKEAQQLLTRLTALGGA